MPYNPSVRSIQRVKNHLDQMLNSDNHLTFKSQDARKLAMWIREGINFARVHTDSLEYGKYATLHGKYIIRLKNNDVVCELRDAPPLGVDVVKTLSKLTIRDVTDGLGVVGALIEHKPEFVYFPDFQFEPVQMMIIFRYCEKNGYFVIHNDVGVTVTKDKNAGVAWTPSN